MSKRLALIVIPLGFVMAMIDAWLSMASMFGILERRTAIGTAIAIVLGLLLTLIAVLSPIIRQHWRFPGAPIVWYTILFLDIGTSVLGAVWYGQLGHNIHTPIDFTDLRFDSQQWFPTSMMIVFVLFVAWVCVQFGRAIQAVTRR